jgi:hypothetical protein
MSTTKSRRTGNPLMGSTWMLAAGILHEGLAGKAVVTVDAHGI